MIKVKLYLFLLLFYPLFTLEYVSAYSIFRATRKFFECSEKSNFKQKIFTRRLFKKRSEVHQNNISRRQLKFSNEFFDHKITEDNCRWRHFAEFIQTEKRYATSIDKISILTGELLITSSLNFSCKLNFSRTYF